MKYTKKLFPYGGQYLARMRLFFMRSFHCKQRTDKTRTQRGDFIGSQVDFFSRFVTTFEKRFKIQPYSLPLLSPSQHFASVRRVSRADRSRRGCRIKSELLLVSIHPNLLSSTSSKRRKKTAGNQKKINNNGVARKDHHTRS